MYCNGEHNLTSMSRRCSPSPISYQFGKPWLIPAQTLVIITAFGKWHSSLFNTGMKLKREAKEMFQAHTHAEMGINRLLFSNSHIQFAKHNLPGTTTNNKGKRQISPF